ncbi:UNVERIFIED_CONTAM: hypothetical protein Sangu_0083400 [Sesamum angustifolium]|uniref:Uncharacterized protein n=1 Tax=Sesamum angustifolium TaxID=2727405 RepID=A0AAW2RL98_9LAMI
MAYRAEDIIESHVSHQISSQGDCCGVKEGLKQLISAMRRAATSQKSRERYMEIELQNVEEKEDDLQKVMEQIDSV